jgi:Type IV secretion-system coupling protein DNA-binding domain
MIDSFMMWVATLIGNGIGSLFFKVGERVPSGRVTDSIRHNRHKRKETAELCHLYTRLHQHTDTAEETLEQLCLRAVTDAVSHSPKQIDERIIESSRRLCWELLRFEGYYPIKEIDFARQLQTSEIWNLTGKIREQLEIFENPKKAREIEQALSLFICNLVDDRLASLPIAGKSGRTALSVPLHTLLYKPADVIQAVGSITDSKSKEIGIFDALSERLNFNLLAVSGIDPARPEVSRRPLIMPAQAKMSPAELVDSYLAGTPFTHFFQTRFSYTLPPSARFEHTHIVGGSGHGKTQLLQSLMLDDLEKIKEGKASVVVIDSQGDMIRHIRELAIVGEMPEHVVLIDPNDIEYPPALNFFDFGLDRLDCYDPVEREKLINGAISLYEYVFGALLGAELTQRQGVIFRYLARLMMVIPGATMQTLMDFMEEPETTKPHLKNLDPTAAHFFETQFFSNKFNDTRQQILTRLWGVRSNSVLDRMFSNKHNKLNLFGAMNSGSLILINTAKELLKQEGCEILGRFFIALICQAAQERASIPENKRQDTFVYIDEAHDYFDESMENLLNQARKYKVAMLISHQNLDQFEAKLKSTVMASTSIKLVGGLSAKDASAFAREMGCEPEYLQGIRKHADRTEFACIVRNYTPNPITLSVPFGAMERQPKITKVQESRLIELNHARYSATNELRSITSPEKPDLNPLEPPELL